MSSASTDRLFAVADDILGLRLPMPPPLEWINAYFLKDGEGWAMVDTGYNTPESRAVLEDVLDNQLGGLPITRVFVTHYHPDHVGQAGYVCRRYKCPLYMSHTEWLLARWLSVDTTQTYRDTITEYYRLAGTPPELVAMISEKGNTFLRTVDEVPPTHLRLEENQVLKIGERSWRVIFGRGHAPEMVTLYDEAGKFLISADHIVARITPNISVWPFDTGSNPLKEYLENTAKFPKLVPDDVTLLPGHGRPFQGFHERVAGFEGHHEGRLNKLRVGLTTEPQSLYQLMKYLFPRELSPRDFVFALGETHAHVNYLLFKNEIKSDPQNAYVFITK